MLGDLKEAWACLDEHVPADRTDLQALFLVAALYAHLEVSPYQIASVPYRDIAVQCGRPEQAIFAEVRGLDALGWAELYDPGIGEHDSGDGNFKAAAWSVGKVWRDTPIGRTRAAERVAAAHDARRFLPTDDQEHLRYMIDQREADWDKDEETGEVDWGYLGGSPSTELRDWLAGWQEAPSIRPFEAEVPWILTIYQPGNCGCQDLASSYVELHKEKYITIQLTTSTRGNDSRTFPLLARSPIDYATWADVFREDEAGVIGWALARRQIREMAPHGGAVKDHLGVVTGPEVARITGVTRQWGTSFLKRLVDRGYARREPGGGYRLLFAEQYAAGALLTDAKAKELWKRGRDDLKRRNARARGEGPNQNPRPMGGFSWEREIFGQPSDSDRRLDS